MNLFLMRKYECLQASLSQFIHDSASLSGHTYDSAKAYSQQILHPLIKGCILLDEVVNTACSKLPSQYRSQVDQVDLKEDELVEQIYKADLFISRYTELITLEYRQDQPSYSYISSLRSSEDRYRSLKQKLEEKLQKLRAFDGSSVYLFSNIQPLIAAVQAGMRQATSSWNAETKVFTLPPAKDMDWVKQVDERWTSYKTENDYKSIIEKIKNGEDVTEQDLIVIENYIKSNPNEVLDSSIVHFLFENELNRYTSYFNAGSYASTGRLAGAEALASIKKIKNGTWWRKPVSTTYSKTGYKTWKQVSGDVSRFNNVKAAKHTEDLLNGTGTFVKGTGVKGAAKSVGLLGSSLAVLDGVSTYFERVDQYGATSAAIDGVAHTGTAVGAMYVGAIIGSAIPIPVVGTLAGAAGGVIVNNLFNIIYDGFSHGKWEWENLFKFW
ncbi:T7SS effector LXG polymorphic toxin [Streptococcus acidominimus]|nr:T7SS effector LXG polymorphic toxin [Streptococcus acidominimus]